MEKTFVLRSGTAMLMMLYQKLKAGYTSYSIPPEMPVGIVSQQTPLYSTPKIILTRSCSNQPDVLIVSILRTGIYIITILSPDPVLTSLSLAHLKLNETLVKAGM